MFVTLIRGRHAVGSVEFGVCSDRPTPDATRLGVSINAGHRGSGDRSGWIRHAERERNDRHAALSERCNFQGLTWEYHDRQSLVIL